MSKEGKGVILYGGGKPPDLITGYLIIGDKHYEVSGVRVSKIRTNLEIREAGDVRQKKDLIDERSGEAGA